MKEGIMERLVKGFERNPGKELLGADICKTLEKELHVTGGSVERRLRILREVGEWPHTWDDTPEHTKARELLGGGKVSSSKKDGLVYYTYTPPATQRVRRTKVIGNTVHEWWEEVSTEDK